MDAFESAGQWWLPEAPDDKVVGLLSFTESEGFRLKIPFGCLGDPFADFTSDGVRTPTIHGYLQNGRHVTLLDCFSLGVHLQMPGAPRQELHANSGLVGRDELPETNPLLDRINLSYLRLRDWVGWHPATCRLGESIADYHYETPDDVLLASGSDWKLSLAHTASRSSVSVEGFHVDHDCRLVIELETPLTLDQVQDALVGPLWRLLTFCLGSDPGAESMKARLADSDRWLEVGRHRSSRSTKDKTITESDMLLSVRQIGDGMQDLVSRWLGFDGDEGRAASLLVGLIVERQAYTDLRFLAAAQALEALARGAARVEELSADEFRRRLRLVADSIAETAVRRWANRHLKHANQRSFSDIIRELVSGIGEYADHMAPAGQRFLDEIRDNRNFYTHRDDKRAGRVIEGEELYILTEAVVLLLKAALLRRLGFSQEEVTQVMNDCQDCVQWRSRVAKQYVLSGSPDRLGP